MITLQKGRGDEEKWDEMVGWHHRLNGYEFEQTPGDGEGQGSLAVHGDSKSWTQPSYRITTTGAA